MDGWLCEIGNAQLLFVSGSRSRAGELPGPFTGIQLAVFFALTCDKETVPLSVVPNSRWEVVVSTREYHTLTVQLK